MASLFQLPDDGGLTDHLITDSTCQLNYAIEQNAPHAPFYIAPG